MNERTSDASEILAMEFGQDPEYQAIAYTLEED